MRMNPRMTTGQINAARRARREWLGGWGGELLTILLASLPVGGALAVASPLLAHGLRGEGSRGGGVHRRGVHAGQGGQVGREGVGVEEPTAVAYSAVHRGRH